MHFHEALSRVNENIVAFRSSWPDGTLLLYSAGAPQQDEESMIATHFVLTALHGKVYIPGWTPTTSVLFADDWEVESIPEQA